MMIIKNSREMIIIIMVSSILLCNTYIKTVLYTKKVYYETKQLLKIFVCK